MAWERFLDYDDRNAWATSWLILILAETTEEEECWILRERGGGGEQHEDELKFEMEWWHAWWVTQSAWLHAPRGQPPCRQDEKDRLEGKKETSPHYVFFFSSHYCFGTHWDTRWQDPYGQPIQSWQCLTRKHVAQGCTGTKRKQFAMSPSNIQYFHSKDL